MLVYRITHHKFSDKLIGSGIENRWNMSGQFVIYSATSKAMACLENLVHTSAEILVSNLYVCMEISIPDTAETTVITLKDLPENFTGEEEKSITQTLGSQWYMANKNLLLKVPSAIISSENNLVINTMHEDFKKVKITAKDPFNFDRRLRQ